MKTFSINNSSFKYANEQICGLTLFLDTCDTVRRITRDAEHLLDKCEHGSNQYIFYRNFSLYRMANNFHSLTMGRKRHIITPDKCECAGGVNVAEMFNQSDRELRECLCRCTSERNGTNDAVELRTCHPGMPAIQSIRTTKYGAGDEEVIDVLHMATSFSPLEYILMYGAVPRCRTDSDFDKDGLLIKTYKEYVSTDAKYVVPIESRSFPLVEAFDMYKVRVNETSRQLLKMERSESSAFTFLMVQLMHLARASFMANSNPIIALTAFLNCAQWKFHLLAIFASKEKDFPSLEIQRETVPLDSNGTTLSVSLMGGKAILESEGASGEKWFKLTKLLVEHLFDKQLNFPSLEEGDEWMALAGVFSFCNAGCSIYDTRSAVRTLDCMSAIRAMGSMVRRAWPLFALRDHDLFFDLLPEKYESSGDEEWDTYRDHYGFADEDEAPPRRRCRFYGMYLSEEPGWSLTVPSLKSMSVVFSGFYEGMLHVRNRKFHFDLKKPRERDDRLCRPVTEAQVMSAGLNCISEESEGSANSVAEMVLSGKAGHRAGRWVLKLLMNNLVDVSAKRPSYLQHLPVVDKGMEVTAPVAQHVVADLEVVGVDSNGDIRIPGNGIIPEYKIEMAYQGYAELRTCNPPGDAEFASSLKVGPALL